MTVRPTNCHLDRRPARHQRRRGRRRRTTRPGTGSARCRPSRPGTSATSWRRPTWLQHPARLVLLQDGADDIDFAACLEYELGRVLGFGIGLGTNCVANGTVTPQVATDLSHVRASLAQAIEAVAPHAGTVAVLDYYQPIPDPGARSPTTPGSRVSAPTSCAPASRPTRPATSAGGPGRPGGAEPGRRRRRGRCPRRTMSPTSRSSTSSTTLDGHGICTRDPWVFSGEPVPDTTLAADVEHILAAKACNGTDVLHGVDVAAPPSTRALTRPSTTSRATSGGRHTRRRPASAPSPRRSSASCRGGSSRSPRAATRRRRPPRRAPPPSSRRRTRAEPTTTPSATSHTSAAWSGVDTPTPTQTGMSVQARMRSTTLATSPPRSARSPVTPMRATA